ncbi:MAG: hypothetical protein R2767_02480 [Chitinophagales bacterium]|nr:hypothetical protein [Chitinophagales bacterium]HPQ21778.1 hypothetical protein [Saprospiraceae bacterium]
MKKVISTSYALFGLSLFSCNGFQGENQKKNDSTISLESSWTMPLILDTFQYKTTTKLSYEFGTANYLPLYLGQFKDSLVVDYQIWPYPPPPPPPVTYKSQDRTDSIVRHEKYQNESRNENLSDDITRFFPVNPSGDFLPWDSAAIEIHIDTTQIIRNIDFESYQDNTHAFKAYPVALTNNSNETIIVGYGTHLALIMEAKDSDGVWQPVEGYFSYSCGTGVPTIILPPADFILTSATIYAGDYETDLRLKIGNNFSEVYRGTINLNQLINK